MRIALLAGGLAPLLVGCPSDVEPGIRNSDPRAEITSHSDGDQPQAGTRLFSGTVDDPDHGVEQLSVSWLYDGGEVCPALSPDSSGNSTCEIFLQSGSRSVALLVEDPIGGLDSAQVDLEVQPYGEPWALIEAPVAGGLYYSDQLIDFLGQVGDAADVASDLEAWWESGGEELDVLAEPDSSGNVIGSGYLEEGDHQLVLKVRNTGANESYDAVTISVGAPNSPPGCAITFPEDGDTGPYGDPVAFTAEVSDPDVPADWLGVSWESDHDGELGISNPDSTGDVAFAASGLSVNTHTITMRVADELGATCSDFIQYTVMDCSDTWYADTDGDGFGDPDAIATGCEQPSAYVTDSSDCDDNDAAIHPDAQETCNGVDDDCDGDIDDDDPSLDTDTATTWHDDSDGDTYGDSSAGSIACSQPSNTVTDSSDCDDGDAAVNPGATEVCNGVDDDCDGDIDGDDPSLDTSTLSTWYLDADTDGYGLATSSNTACDQPSGYVVDSSDCDDSDDATYPGADEYCDGLDTNCDGTTDEDDALDASSWFADADGDGFGDPLDTSHACTAPSGYVADDTDCDDTSGATYPGADEYCDGTDTDCDGTTDADDALDASIWYADADGDGYGDDGTIAAACYGPSGYVSVGGDCDDTTWSVNPSSTEICSGVDDDCDGSTDDDDGDLDASTASTWYTDSDGDGYGDASTGTTACTAPSGFELDGTDCDDGDATINPGAAEVCSGADDDCDGLVDDDDGSLDSSTASTWYADVDGDGYGDVSASSLTCEQPSGTVSSSTDCDDGEPAVNPVATEVCDGMDDDCDSLVDDDDPGVDVATMGTWYVDADADGYGDSSTATWACDAPSGYVTDDEDCDDGDSSLNPGASEVYDLTDWTDENCDGWAGVLYDDFDSGHSPGDRVTTGTGECADSTVSSSIDTDTWDGCGNGNVSTYSTGYAYSGSYSISTQAGSGEVGQVLSALGTNFRVSFAFLGVDTPSSGNQWFIFGDHTDGTGVAVGWDSRSSCGAAYSVVPAGWDGASTPQCIGTRTPETWSYAEIEASYSSTTSGEIDVCIDGSCISSTEPFGVPLAAFFTNDDAVDGYFDDVDIEVLTGDDLDGDGYFAWVDCDDSDASINPGAVDVCGNGIDEDCDDDPADCSFDATSSLADAAVKFTGRATDERAGSSVSSAGDVNGDGLMDVIIGAAADDAGAAYLILGSTGLSDTSLSGADARFDGESSGDGAGTAVAGAGDVNGDGWDDILVGATGSDAAGSNAGAAYLVLGGSSPVDTSLSSAQARYLGESTADIAGFSLAGVGDVDGDGFDDMLIGARDADSSASDEGAVYLVCGSSSPADASLSAADARFTGEASRDWAGSSIAGTGDVDGDGLDDILIGANGNDTAGSYSGAAYLVLGAVGLLDQPLSSSDVIFTAEASGDSLGLAVSGAGDVDGDGYADILLGAPYCDTGATDSGATYLVLGSSSPVDLSVADAEARYSGEIENDRTGNAVSGAGDVNADGFDDIVIGLMNSDMPGNLGGVTYLVLGDTWPASISLSSADANFVGEAESDSAGYAVSSAGDVDFDGFDDILIGAPGNDSNGADSGAIYLIFGIGE